MNRFSKKEQKQLIRILIAAVLLLVLKFLPEVWYLYLIPYAIIGWDILYRAGRNLLHGQIFDENFLMAIATVGAFATAEYSESVFVMLFYQTGELFQSYAVGKSRQSIATLMDIRPDIAHVEKEDGTIEDVDPEDVEVGATVVVRSGERIPLDGTVLSGSSTLDTSALTGESVPRDVAPGDPCLSGCVNLSGLLRLEVTRLCEESTVSRILELVENASEQKSSSERFITRFARYYTPCVVIAAALLAVIPPLFLGNWGSWFHRALVFLVVSCPCALVISVPLSFFGGIGGASKCGILIKGGNDLEALARTETVVFDKTGTLTRGTFSVTAIHPEKDVTEDALLELAALAESWSTHPIATSLKEACKAPLNPDRIQEVEELSGYGIRAKVDGRPLFVGNHRLMEQQGISCPSEQETGTMVHVLLDGRYLGYLVISDLPKEDAAEAIAALKASGIKRTVMLTGDRAAAAKEVAAELGLDEFHAELLPADKVSFVEKMLAEKRSGSTLAFVGDGINDAPVLTRADVGIAMGAMGSDAAIEAADVVLMDDHPARIATAIRISRKTLRIVHQNIWFALGIKFSVLILGALGFASMWAAVFADVGVAFLAILNAMRCLRVKNV